VEVNTLLYVGAILLGIAVTRYLDYIGLIPVVPLWGLFKELVKVHPTLHSIQERTLDFAGGFLGRDLYANLIVRFIVRLPLIAVGIPTLAVAVGVTLPLAYVGLFVRCLERFLHWLFLKLVDWSLRGESTSWLEEWLQGRMKDENVRKELQQIPFIGLIGLILVTIGFVQQL